jgi:lysophospholipase L1-like esterase
MFVKKSLNQISVIGRGEKIEPETDEVFNVLLSATDGSELDYANAKTTDFIPILSDTYYLISGTSAYKWAIYVFYDYDKKFISSYASEDGGTPTVLKDKEVVSPSNAAYIRVSTYYSSAVGSVYNAVYESKGAKQWKGVKWTCIGDSLTEHNSRTLKNYHDYIAENTGIEVVNMGVSGSGYKRKDDENKAFYQRVANVPTDSNVVTIFGSGNDMGSGINLGNITDTGTDTLCGCINRTIDNLIDIMPTVQLGIITPTPWVGYPPSTDNAMKKYSEAIIDICRIRSIPCLDLYHCSNLRPWTEEGRNACYTRDEGNGVHPDETGHKIIASRFKAFLESLIM